MSLTITHPFVSLIDDSGDTTLVQPSDWNANHSVSIVTDLSPDTAGGATLGTSLLPWGASFFSSTLTITQATAGVTAAVFSGVAATYNFDYQGSGFSYFDQAQIEYRNFGGTQTYARLQRATSPGVGGTITMFGLDATGIPQIALQNSSGISGQFGLTGSGNVPANQFFVYSNTASAGFLTTWDANTTLAAGKMAVLFTTASTSTTTGALVVSGGAGVAGAINAGTQFKSFAPISGYNFYGYSGVSGTAAGLFLNAVDTVGFSVAATDASGGYAQFGTTTAHQLIFFSNGATRLSFASTGAATFATTSPVTVSSTTASTSTTTGALVVSGGVGIAGAVFIGTNLSVGATSFGTAAVNVIAMLNATAPTTSPANTGQLYVLAGALTYRGSSGTVTTIAPA